MAIPVLDPQCACDEVAQSQYGPIGDDERIARILTDKHFKGATILTSAFKIEDIKGEGISLVRLRMCDVGEFQEVADDVRTQNPNASSVQGALVQQARLIRSLRHPDGTRMLCLFDDPVIDDPILRDNPAHCMAVAPALIENADAQEIRAHLLDLFREAKYLGDLWADSLLADNDNLDDTGSTDIDDGGVTPD